MPNIEQASDYIFRVESDSDAEKHYIVDVTPGKPAQCTCVAWVMKRNKTGTGTCKHCVRVVDFMVSDVKVKAQKERDDTQFRNIAAELQRTMEELA